MSYEDAYLDLSSINVACLSGANGAGKSALLDAVTWAIWEKGRASSDELIRLGQKEMWIDLIFSHEGNTYRVRRSRQRTPSRSGNKATSKGTVDLQMLNTGQSESENTLSGNDSLSKIGKWKSLTAGSIAETQEKILHLLRMDYQTFVNSAYLKQGAADQFARETAMKRKEILGEILNLSYFDRLQERCKERLKPLKEKSEHLASLLSRQPEIDSQLSLLETEQENIQNSLNQYRQEKEKLETSLLALQRKEHELVSSEEKQASIQVHLSSLNDEIESLTKQKVRLTERLESLKQLINDKAHLEADFAQYEITLATLKNLEEKSSAAQSLEKHKVELRAKLSEDRTALEIELKQLEKELLDFTQRKTKLTSDTEKQDLIVGEHKQFINLVNREAELAKQQEAYTQLKQRIAELQTIIDEANIRLATEIEHKTNQFNHLKSILESQGSLDKQKVDLEAKEAELDKKENEFQYVIEKGQDIKVNIENIKQQVIEREKRQQEYLNKIEELNKAQDSTICPLCSSKIVDRNAVINQYQHQIQQAKKEIIDLENDLNQLDSQRNSLRTRYTELNNELIQRKQLDTQKGQLVEKVRAVNEAQNSLSQLGDELAILKDRQETNDYATVQKISAIDLTAELNGLNFDPVLYASTQSQLRSQRGIETRYHQLQKDLAELDKIETTLPELLKKMESLKMILHEESYGGTLRDSIRQLDKEYEQINYNNDEHNQFKEKLNSLMPIVDKYKDLKHALAELPTVEHSLEESQSWLVSKNRQFTELTAQYELTSTTVKDLPALKTQIAALKLEVVASQNHYENLLHEQAKISANLELFRKEDESLKDKNKELGETQKAVDDFAYLAECFGKKGIQAIVIENAIPEIETDANRILSRLTDNKMHVGLITQQKSKTGNISETLDIVISDDIGTRNYELYSGGEAFKVNFALRVALSRLLARRAGAKLETLIIDEGFGSQDDSSRDKLVKAISSIQPDFARILVITHFSDVKEMFPTHIQVTKINGISQIELIN